MTERVETYLDLSEVAFEADGGLTELTPAAAYGSSGRHLVVLDCDAGAVGDGLSKPGSQALRLKHRSSDETEIEDDRIQRLNQRGQSSMRLSLERRLHRRRDLRCSGSKRIPQSA